MKSKMKRFIAATALAVSMVSVSALAAGCVGTSSKPGNSKPSQSSSNSSSSSSSSSTPLALRTLYFRENGATGGSMSVLRLYPGDMVTLAPNAYTRTGYTFKGWATSANGMVMYLDGSNYIMGEEVSYELFAVWQKIEYPITYELNGGVAAENPATYTIEDTFTFASPTKSEYTFAGWYTDPEFENPKSSVSAGEYGELTLYA
ncbi:MAG: InlB B-repeat-containing protein, partial [Clostridia bacterium]|nr:InlB B-repeat-containing protein [Clostridia bacterium]